MLSIFQFIFYFSGQLFHFPTTNRNMKIRKSYKNFFKKKLAKSIQPVSIDSAFHFYLCTIGIKYNRQINYIHIQIDYDLILYNKMIAYTKKIQRLFVYNFFCSFLIHLDLRVSVSDIILDTGSQPSHQETIPLHFLFEK